MLSRRIIAISPDKAFGKQLATALKAAGGSVEAHVGLDALGRGELQVALVVLHVADEMAGALAEILPRLTGDAKVIVVLPKANLASTVDLMQASERIAGVLVAEGFTLPHLAAMATRVLAGDIFGLEKLMPWGTKIHSTVIGDYQEKSAAIAQISELAEQMGVRRKYREAIEQSVDEMLMNALYDAPVDEQGRPIFSEIPTKTRISLRVEQKVVVQYACDGVQFGVSVRDAFGTLERSTVLRYLYKCLHSEQQIDHKTGGAGLGLYLIANNATRLYFNVLPGVATEAMVSCSLESPRIQLEEIGFFTEKIDAGGRLAGGVSRRLPTGVGFPVERRAAAPTASPRVVVGVLAAAITAILVMIGVVAYPRLFGPGKTALTFTTRPPGATITIDGRARGVTTGGTLTVGGLTAGKAYVVGATLDGYEPVQTVIEATKGAAPTAFVLAPRSATVTVESDPPGAAIIIDGVEVGRTPHALGTLAPGSRVTVTLHQDGFVDATQAIEVPPPGKEAKVVVPLGLSPDFASVVISSEPPGARVYKNGELVPGVTTPTDELIIEANRPTTFTVSLPGHVPEVVEAKPGRGSRRNKLAAALVPGLAVTVKANISGFATIEGVPGCRRVPVPGECVVKRGEYAVTFEGDAGAKAKGKLDARAGPAAVTFAFGFVEARAGHRLRLTQGGASMTRGALEEGRRTVYVTGEGGNEPTQVTIKAGKVTYVP